MPDDTNSPVRLRIPRLGEPLRLIVHGERDRFVSRQIREEGIWEPYETSLLLDLLAPGGVFVDVGANLGYFSMVAARAVGGNGRVFAFEPEPENFRLLQANAELNGLQPRIHSLQAGLAAGDGQGRLYLSATNLGDHRIRAPGAVGESLPIALINGGQYLEGRLSRIDVLKVDTQGSEYEVMLGLMPLLRRLPRPLRILIELTPLSLRQSGACGRALVELLATLEMPMWIVDHIGHRLSRHSAEALARWCDNVDAAEGDEGFMNILVGPAP